MLDVRRHTTPDGCAVCQPVGELDSYTVCRLRQVLAELAASPRLVMDLSAVVFIDSAGIGALVGGVRRVRGLGGQVAVACNRPSLLRALSTTGFDRIVTVVGSVSEAAALLRRPAALAET